MPVAVRTVASGGLRVVRRPAAARDGGVDEPDLRPAAPPRQEREAAAVGRPARRRAPPGFGDDRVLARAVGLDDPELVVADEREAASIGRPLRVADGLLRRRELGRGPPRSGSVNSWRAPAASAV